MLEMKIPMSSKKSFLIVRLWVAAMLLEGFLLPAQAVTRKVVRLEAVKTGSACKAGPINHSVHLALALTLWREPV
jgi:hypothetical protein